MNTGMKHPKPAVAAVIVRDQEILLIKRGAEPGMGQWSIPGGSMNIGETIEEAVKREVLEETGLVVEVGKLAGVYNLIVRQDDEILFHYVILDYFAKVVSGTAAAATDAVECRWVPFSELKDYEMTELLAKRLKEMGVMPK